jgi:hypothetical protein
MGALLMNKILIAGAALFGATLLAQPALALNPDLCASREEVVKLLADNFDETPVAGGLSNAGLVVEVFASRDRNSWTMVMKAPTGMTCIIGSGENWDDQPRQEASVAQRGS